MNYDHLSVHQSCARFKQFNGQRNGAIGNITAE